MRLARSRFRRSPSKKPKKPVKKVNRYYGLPKGEVMRRIAAVNVSKHDDEPTILYVLKIVDELLEFARLKSCCVCGKRRPSEAHHVLTRGARNPDFWNVVPACWGPGSCHDKAQRHEDSRARPGPGGVRRDRRVSGEPAGHRRLPAGARGHASSAGRCSRGRVSLAPGGYCVGCGVHCRGVA